MRMMWCACRYFMNETSAMLGAYGVCAISYPVVDVYIHLYPRRADRLSTHAIATEPLGDRLHFASRTRDG